MGLNGSIKIMADFIQEAAADLERGRSEVHGAFVQQYGDGAGAGQANVMFTDRRTLAASADEDLDLSGSLASLLGPAVFARVKTVLIVAAAANPTDGVLRVTRPSAGVPFPNITAEDSIFPDIGPGGMRLMSEGTAAGVAVTASTADLINIANTSATAAATYDIVVIGASA